MFERIKAVRAYKKLFLTEEGALSPEAKIVFNDLYRFTRFHKDAPAEPQALALTEGSRSTVRHMLKRTGQTGAELERNLRETITGEDYE